MSKGPADAPQKYLRTKEAAPIVGLCARTLEKHRTYGTGPKYRKVGGRVLYDIDDLHDLDRAWYAHAHQRCQRDLCSACQAACRPRAGLCRPAPSRLLGVDWKFGRKQGIGL